MTTTLPDAFRLELARAEAEARGLAGRLRALADRREEDGLVRDEAELVAAESLGLTRDLDDVLDAALAPLSTLEEPLDAVDVSSAPADMPTLRRQGAYATLTLPTVTFADVTEIVNRLVAALVANPARTTVQLIVGLGGSGGCACGDVLPEDAPPGPLFAPR